MPPLDSNIPDTKNNITALFGTFHLDMSPLETMDVTNDVKKLIKAEKIVIPNSKSLSEIFGITSLGEKKYLQIKINDRIHNIAEDTYHFNVIIDVNDNTKRIKIIYYLYVNPHSNWRSIVSSQLMELQSYGIFGDAELYIHITDTFNLLPEVKRLINDIVPFSIISNSSQNQYEYPGIKLVHELAKKHPSDIFIYFHSKGMSHNVHTRSKLEMTLFTKTFENWRKNIQLFSDSKINKIGLFPAIGYNKDKARVGVSGGWLWYNFWYSKGHYLAECEDPKVSSDRFYYEDWLARKHGNEAQIVNDCKNIYRVKYLSKIYFTPDEALYHLTVLSDESSKLGCISNPFLLNYYLNIKQILRNIIRRD